MEHQLDLELSKPHRKPYHEPQLNIWGDLRTLTLGGTPGGGGDSGDPGLKYLRANGNGGYIPGQEDVI